jgi:hypothetical protein
MAIALSVCAVAFLLATSTVLAEEAPDLDWSQLVDQSVQDYDDPYRELTHEQLISLVTVARLREKAAKGEPIDEEHLSREMASLAVARIDVDELIAQRWVVAERRERAATSGNKAVDGREVVLSGFVIPAPPDADGSATAYLVAERGMCSHMPPPPPNQMIRLRLPDNWRPRPLYEPVRVSGLLSIEPTTRTVPVVDGLVPMHATFTMNVSSVETPGSLQGADVSQNMASDPSRSHRRTNDEHEH